MHLHVIDTFDIRFPRRNPRIENGFRSFDASKLEGRDLSIVDKLVKTSRRSCKTERLLISAENAFWRDKDVFFIVAFFFTTVNVSKACHASREKRESGTDSCQASFALPLNRSDVAMQHVTRKYVKIN